MGLEGFELVSEFVDRLCFFSVFESGLTSGLRLEELGSALGLQVCVDSSRLRLCLDRLSGFLEVSAG